MNDLLTKGREQLNSHEPESFRRACWLTRAALEKVIDSLLRAKGIAADRASERAKLTCLEGAYIDDRVLAHKAEYAWNRLSEACHQHAYQLSPIYEEVRDLIDLVEHLSDSLANESTEHTHERGDYRD